MEPFDLSCRYMATQLNVAASTLNRVLKMLSGVSPEMVLRFSKALGRSPERWFAMQDAYDLWQEKKRVKLSDVCKINLSLSKISDPDNIEILSYASGGQTNT